MKQYETPEELTGTLHSGREVKPGFYIGNLITKNGKIPVVGEATQKELSIGQVYRFSGKFSSHAKFGRQFRFDSFVQPKPCGNFAIVGYLQQCRGIGIVRAENMVKRYGENTLEKIRKFPDQVAEEMGLDTSILKDAAQLLAMNQALESATLEIATLFNGKGFPKCLKRKLLEKYGEKAAEKIHENPYFLTQYHGVGFRLADSVYLELGKDPEAMERKVQYLLFLVQDDSSGSTVLDVQKLLASFREMFHFSKDSDFWDALHTLIETEQIHGDNIQVMRMEDYRDEILIRENIDRLSRFSEGFEFPESSPLTEHQREEAKKATLFNVGILAGSPGTGKTFTAAQIIKQCGTEGVCVAAPTGKAALRITEAMNEYGIDIQATTIHGLLESRMMNGEFIFERSRFNPIDAQYIFIDESSMIDTRLMALLLDAVADGTRILFIGDPDQLPPVGRGAPLRDFITMGNSYSIALGKLTEIRRNSGAIVEACQQICNAHPFAIKNYMPSGSDNLVYTYSILTAENVVQLLGRIGETDPMKIQVIVAMNSRGNCSRSALNTILQLHYNANAETSDRRWKLNDKVICLANGTAEKISDKEKMRISNGDIGRVTEILSDRTIVLVNGIEIIVPRCDERWSEADWDLGYAITCHKSQGSEWPRVVVILDPMGVQSICDRHWIYTAISRAKKECYLIGSPSTTVEMVRKTNMWERKTGFLIEKENNCERS